MKNVPIQYIPGFVENPDKVSSVYELDWVDVTRNAENSSPSYPKCDRQDCGRRISLTFRGYLDPSV